VTSAATAATLSAAGQASYVFSDTGPSAIGASARNTAAAPMRRRPAPSRARTYVTQKIAASVQSVISALNSAS
jgi:hypothetical protein